MGFLGLDEIEETFCKIRSSLEEFPRQCFQLGLLCLTHRSENGLNKFVHGLGACGSDNAPEHRCAKTVEDGQDLVFRVDDTECRGNGREVEVSGDGSNIFCAVGTGEQNGKKLENALFPLKNFGGTVVRIRRGFDLKGTRRNERDRQVEEVCLVERLGRKESRLMGSGLNYGVFVEWVEMLTLVNGKSDAGCIDGGNALNEIFRDHCTTEMGNQLRKNIH